MSRKIQTFRRYNTTSTDQKLPNIMDLTKVNVPPKRKGGRTSRLAMKNNKINSSLQRKNVIKEGLGLDHHDHVQVVDIAAGPQTPTMEKATLSTTLDQDVSLLDHHKQPSCSSPCQEAGTGEASIVQVGSDDIGQLLSLCPCDENTTENSMSLQKPSFEKKENSDDEVLGPLYEEESIDDGMLLCFNDIIDSELLNPNGVLTLSEESLNVSGALMTRTTTTTTSTNSNSNTTPSYNLASNNEELEISTTSKNLSSSGEVSEYWLDDVVGDDFWSWKSSTSANVAQGQDPHQMWDDEKEKMLSLLWDNDNSWELEDNNHKLEDMINSEKQNAMVAWLLS